jgi:hypothetical protein
MALKIKQQIFVGVENTGVYQEINKHQYSVMCKPCESYQILSRCTREVSHEFNFTSDTVNGIVGIMCTWSGYKITGLIFCRLSLALETASEVAY